VRAATLNARVFLGAQAGSAGQQPDERRLVLLAERDDGEDAKAASMRLMLAA
jgi:hypothetical protein